MFNDLLSWDRETFIYLNSLGIEKYDQIWSIATNISTWIPLYIFLIFLVAYSTPKKEVLQKIITIVIMLLFVLAITYLTKYCVGRARPNIDASLNTFIRVVNSSQGYSFFSGHASFAFALTTSVVLFLKDKFKWIWFLYLWAVLLAFSRIYIGVHYPIDLIMGAVVGMLSANLFYGLYSKFTKPYSW